MNRFLAPKQHPLILGHRGVPKLHQENTLAGVLRAIDLGIDGVEVDVFLTRDDRVVLFHDTDPERLTGVTGDIRKMTWDEVSQLRIKQAVSMGQGADGNERVVFYPSEERIPLMEEVLAEVGDRLVMNIELKPPAGPWDRGLGARVADLVRAAGCQDQVIVTSFDLFKLKAVEKAWPALHSGFAYDDDFANLYRDWLNRLPLLADDGAANAETTIMRLMEKNVIGRKAGSTVVGAEYTLINAATVEHFRALGMAIGAYTLLPLDTRNVQQPLSHAEGLAEAQRLIDLGVDWIETDDPSAVQALLG